MNEITTPQDFETKMKARIKESIGDLITDEQLATLIKAGLDDAFLKPRIEVVKDTNYSYRDKTITHPPFIQAIAKELLEEQVKAQVENYIVEHDKEILRYIQGVVTNGAGNAFLLAITEAFKMPLMNLEVQSNAMINQLRSKGVVS